LNSDLKIEEYEPKTAGIYVVDMIGPINSEWRGQLEEKGVEVIDYVPNYAYRVRMTPEQAEEVEDKFFVDWVGIYQPEFKLQQDIEPGRIEVGLAPSASEETFEEIKDLVSEFSYSELPGEGFNVRTNVESQEILNELAKMNDVYYINEHSEPELHSEVESQITGGGLWIMEDDDTDRSEPYRKHGDYGAYINQIGYSGEGVTIAIADTGIGDGEEGSAGHPDFGDRVLGGHNWEEPDYWGDGHYHGTHCAGLAAGNTYNGTEETYDGEETGPYYLSQGLAYESELYSVKIFDDFAIGWVGPEDYFEIIEVPAQESDAYVHSNSWGAPTAGMYIGNDHIYDAAVRDANRDTDENEPMVITSSAGNSGSGEQTTGSPGNAKNVITVGATHSLYPDGEDYGGVDRDNPDNIVDYSSRGWTGDNRIKPDVVAPGDLTVSTQTPQGEGTYTEDDRYRWMGGTSSSNPVVAGAASVVVEWYEDEFGEKPSPAMVRSLLINTAEPLDEKNGNTGPIPNQDEGWGMVDISKLEYPEEEPIPFYTDDQENTFKNSGEVHEYQVEHEDPDEPLKITLGWTDKEAPFDTGENPSLINDLNLEIESPGGLIYQGNAFTEGWSQPFEDSIEDFDRTGDGLDDTNNVQNVYIPPDDIEDGIYTIRVEGANIADDAVGIGENSQDYALTAYNAVDGEIVGEPPSVDINRPVGEEIWTGHDQEDLEWTATAGDDELDRINLFYSIDGGDTWNLIEEDLDPLDGLYSWSVANEPSEEAQIRTVVLDEVGRNAVDVSEDFTIEGIPPEPPEYPLVEYHDVTTEMFFEDDVSEDKGYTTGSSEGENEWDIRNHSAYKGNQSWDWGDNEYEKSGEVSWLISPEIEIPEEPDNIELSFKHWRDIDPTWDGGNLKISTESPDPDGDWELIEDPDPAYDGEIGEGWDNPIEGEPAWWGLETWEDVSVPLCDYAGENVWFRWDVGVEQYTGNNRGWRIDDIRVTGDVETEDAHNRIRWYQSPSEDIDEVSHYNVYRSEEREGPWDEDSVIGSVDADGSEIYDYVDPYKGEEDDTDWWYLVRAVGTNELEEMNEYSKQEPGDPEVELPEITISQPEGEEEWSAYEEEIIEWDTEEGEEAIDYIDRLWYSIDAGDNWRTIDEILADDGSFDWTIPNWPSEEAIIRARVVDEHGRFSEDQSEIFEIVGEPPEAPEEQQVEHVDVEENWNWMYEGEHRPEEDSALGMTEPGEWYAAIRTELPEGKLEQIAYFDLHPAPTLSGSIHEDEDNEPADKVAETGDFEGIPEEKWREVPLKESTQIEGGYYWFILEIYDQGPDEFPLGMIEPYVSDGGFISTDGEIWHTLPEYEQNYSWAMEVSVEEIDKDGHEHNLISWNSSPHDPFDDPREISHYNIYRSEDESGPWNEETLVKSVDADGSEEYQMIDYDKGSANETRWWYVIRAEAINEMEEDNEEAIQEPLPPTLEPPKRVRVHHDGEDNEDNLLTWYASSDEEKERMSHYNIHRAEDRDGPWDEETLIEEIDADGSESYSFVDSGRGQNDETNYWYLIRTEDTYGQEEQNENVKYEPSDQEIEPPEIVLEQPDGGERWYEQTEQEIIWETFEEDEAIDYVDLEYSVDGGSTWNKIVEGLDDSGSFDWIVPSEYTDQALIRAEVIDDISYYDEDTSEQTFEILGDDTPPSLDVVNPSDDEVISTANVIVEWEGYDDYSGISHYEISINGDTWTDLGELESYEFEDLEEGEHTVEVKAVDNAGNERVESISFMVDLTPPEIMIMSPEEDEVISSNDVEVLWSGYDEITDIDYYEVRCPEEEDWIHTGRSTWYEFSDLDDGEYTTEVRAVDEAGHQAVEELTFTIDTQPPEVYIDSPIEDEIIQDDSVNLTWSGEDMVSAIEKYEIRLGDYGWIEYDAPEPPAEGGELIGQYENHEDWVNSVYESDGILYSASRDETVVAYDYEEDEVIWSHDHHESSVETVYESEGIVFSGGDLGFGEPGELIASDAETGELLWTHELHGDTIDSIVADDGVVYSGSRDETLIAFDYEEEEMLWQHDHHEGQVRALSISDGIIYSGSMDTTVVAADVETGDFIWEHDHHGAAIFGISSSDEKVFTVSHLDGLVIAADAEDGELVWEHDHHEDMPYAVHEYNGVVYSGSMAGEVIAADAEDGEFQWVHDHHEDSVRDIHVSEGTVFSGSDDQTVVAAEAGDEEPEDLFHTFNNIPDGEYTVYVRATDYGGNQHTETVDFVIESPELQLDITTPDDGVEELTYDSDFTIEGTTEPEAMIWIDEENVETDEDGDFMYETALLEGQNLITVMAEDEDGNQAETTVSVLYLPDIQEMWDSIDQIESDIEAIETDINTIESDIEAIEADIAELEDYIADVEANIEYELDDLWDEIDDLEDDIDALWTELDDLEEDQTDDISMARNLGIVGIVLAILALIIAIVSVTKRGKDEDGPGYEEEVIFEEEDEEVMVSEEEPIKGEAELFEEEETS